MKRMVWLGTGRCRAVGLLLYLLLCNGFTPISWAGDIPVPLELPARIETRPGKMVRIDAKTQGKLVRWHLEGGEGAGDLIVMESTRAAVFCSPQGGSFRILAWTAIADQPSEGALCVVEVRETVDPFVELRQLARHDPDPQRKESLAALARVYREGSKLIREGAAKTIGDLHEGMARLAARELTQGSLAKVRDHLASRTSRELPRQPDLPLDETLARRATAWFDKVALVLEQESHGEGQR